MTQRDVQIDHVADAAPWYAGLTRKHWRVLWGSYLGWIFDGYEAFALILALPPALNSLLPRRTGRVLRRDLCGTCDRHHAARLGHRRSRGRRHRRLCRPQAHDGARGVLLCAADRHHGVQHQPHHADRDALPDRARHRRRMEHGHRACRRILARQGAAQGARPAAIRVRRGRGDGRRDLVLPRDVSAAWAAKPGGFCSSSARFRASACST